MIAAAVFSTRAAEVAATNTVRELKQLTLEELLDTPIETSGTLAAETPRMSPVAVTVITAEDIRVTPHRNILDLIEVYVPGAQVMTHSDGLKLGMRGIMSDRNLKFLLLVNGRNLNQKAHSGAAAELTNWDTSDIERIEVIRGPGSVTYGPGAMAGVVNIITRTGRHIEKTELAYKYTSEYDSHVVSFDFGQKKPNWELAFHLGIATTEGVDDPNAFSMEQSLAKGFGFVGTSDFVADNPPGFSLKANPPHPYLRDYEHEPQLKAHVDLKLGNEWRIWARYTSSGGTVDFRDGLARFQQALIGTNQVFGGLEIFKQVRTRDATLNIGNDHEFTSWFRLETKAGLGSQDFERRAFAPVSYTSAPPAEIQAQLAGPGSMRYTAQDFAEDEVYAQVLAHFTPMPKTHAALGAEYLLSHFGPGWWDDPREFRIGESGAVGQPNILNGPDSFGINPPGVTGYRGLTPAQAIFVGDDGWTTHTYSLLGELKLEQLSWFNVLLSGRLDKHRDTDFLFSPRLAIVSKLHPRHWLKLSWQQSVRMGTGEQLLISHLMGEKNTPEELRAVEFSYTTLPVDQLQLSATAFYNQLDAVGWVSGGGSVSNTTSLGTQKHVGLEFEAAYAEGPWRAGLNHSFVKLLDWEMAPGITGTGISFADYDVTTGGSTLTGSGHDLHNWANHVTKAYVDYRFLKRFTAHVNALVFWEYEGAQDQFDMVERAVAGTPGEAAVRAAIAQLKADDAFALDFRLNASLTCEVKDWLSVTVFCQNLVDVTGNRRYDYDTGTRNLLPRVFYVEEPRTVGVLAKLRF